VQYMVLRRGMLCAQQAGDFVQEQQTSNSTKVQPVL